MNISSVGARYQFNRGFSNKSIEEQRQFTMPMPSRASGGVEHPTLDFIQPPHSPAGEAFHYDGINYDYFALYMAEGSTEEDPIIRASGVLGDGSSFETTFHLNSIDPSNANYMEMLALIRYEPPSGVSNFNQRDLAMIQVIGGMHSQDLFTKINYMEEAGKIAVGLSNIEGYEEQGREMFDLLSKLQLFFVQHTSDRENAVMDLIE